MFARAAFVLCGVPPESRGWPRNQPAIAFAVSMSCDIPQNEAARGEVNIDRALSAYSNQELFHQFCDILVNISSISVLLRWHILLVRQHAFESSLVCSQVDTSWLTNSAPQPRRRRMRWCRSHHAKAWGALARIYGNAETSQTFLRARKRLRRLRLTQEVTSYLHKTWP